MDFEASSVNLFRRFENQVVFGAFNQRRICPVTVISGELGSGKTTLLKHILTNKSNLTITAIVNDFAALNVDASFIRRTAPDEKVIELSNGCMCCIGSVANDFEDAIWRTLNPDEARQFPDAIVIETSGVTDPTQIISRLERTYGRMTRCRLDCVVAVVDSDVAVARVDPFPSSGVVLNQIRAADVVLLNKIELVGDDQLRSLQAAVRDLVPGVRILTSSFGRVPLRCLLDLDPDPIAGQVVSHDGASLRATQLSMSAVGGSLRLARQRQAQLQPSTQPNDDYVAVVLTCEAPLDLGRFQDWLDHSLPADVRRLKGFVWFAHERAGYRELQLSGRRRLHISEFMRWERRPEASLVVIGRHLDARSLSESFSELSSLSSSDRVAQNRPDQIDAPIGIQLIDNEQSASLWEDYRILSFRYHPSIVNMADDDAQRIGFDIDQLQLQLISTVNSDPDHMVLLMYRLEESRLILQWASDRHLSVKEVLALIAAHGDSLMQRVLSETHWCPRSF